jgi:cyclase
MKANKSVFVLLMAIGHYFNYAQSNMDNAVINTVKIKDHMHMLQWTGAGNMLLLSGTDGNILIDDQFAQLSEKINSAIQAVSKGQVKYYFSS